MAKLPANLLDLPMEVRAGMAMKDSVAYVIEDHIRSRRPIYIGATAK